MSRALPAKHNVLAHLPEWRTYLDSLRTLVEQCAHERERDMWVTHFAALFEAHVQPLLPEARFQRDAVQGASELQDGVRLRHEWRYEQPVDGTPVLMGTRGYATPGGEATPARSPRSDDVGAAADESPKGSAYFTSLHVKVGILVVHYDEPVLAPA